MGANELAEGAKRVSVRHVRRAELCEALEPGGESVLRSGGAENEAQEPHCCPIPPASWWPPRPLIK